MIHITLPDNSVKEFVDAMYVSERNQLEAMCNFIKSNNKMYTALKNKDFNTFASIYNIYISSI